MKTLILVRHAKSSRDDPALADADRPLSRRGRRDAQKMARKFSRSACRPDLLVASPSRRTRETAAFFVQDLALPETAVQFDPRIYEAERADLVRLVHGLDDRYGAVMLVGHNPGFTDLFHHLLDSKIHHLPAGAVAVIELPAAAWRDAACNSGQMKEFFCPDTEKLQMKDADETLPPLTLKEKIFYWRMQVDRKAELFGFFLLGLALIVGIALLVIGRMRAGSEEPAGYRPYHVIEGDKK